MELFFEILDTKSQISNNILQAIAEEFNSIIERNIKKIKENISSGVINLLKSTDTYLSLIGQYANITSVPVGSLAGHFGLPYRGRVEMVDAILKKIGDNIEVKHNVVKVRAGNFSGGIDIGILISDFSDILSMSEAVVTAEGGQNLRWLQWLLLEGNSIIVKEYEIGFLRGEGRSGQAIMIPKSAGVWRVPIEYSGTMNDNWLTRAFSENVDKLTDVIQNSMKEIL